MTTNKYEVFEIPNLIDHDLPTTLLAGIRTRIFDIDIGCRHYVTKVRMVICGQPAARGTVATCRVSSGGLTEQPGCQGERKAPLAYPFRPGQ